MLTLVIATRNEHKVQEIKGILGSGCRYLTLRDFPEAPAVVEDAGTFAGNATKKAVELAKWLQAQGLEAGYQAPGFRRSDGVAGAALAGESYVLADDSGLEVDALDGAPGVHSARFAALASGGVGNSTDVENNARLLGLLEGVPAERRTARFRCVIALCPVMRQDQESASPVCYADESELATRLFEGACEGRIGFAPKGRGGFGYDPLFTPNGYELSFAELGADIKNRLSHRARALESLRRALSTLRA